MWPRFWTFRLLVQHLLEGPKVPVRTFEQIIDQVRYCIRPLAGVKLVMRIAHCCGESIVSLHVSCAGAILRNSDIPNETNPLALNSFQQFESQNPDIKVDMEVASKRWPIFGLDGGTPAVLCSRRLAIPCFRCLEHCAVLRKPHDCPVLALHFVLIY